MARPTLWRRLGRGKTATFEAPPPPTAALAAGELIVGIAVLAFGLWGVLGTLIFAGDATTVGAGRMAGFAFTIPFVIATFGLAMAVDGALRVRGSLQARLSWNALMTDEAERNRTIAEIAQAIRDDTSQKPAAQLSAGALRVRARNLLKRRGIAGAHLLDYLAHQAAERVNENR